MVRTVVFIFLCHSGYSQLACIQVSSATCPDVDGFFYLSTDSTYYREESVEIAFTNSGTPGWYMDSNNDSDVFYVPTTDNLNLPLTGWLVYEPCNGGVMNDPADVIIQIIPCERSGPCYAVSTDCQDLGGIYQQWPLVTYNGRPVYFDEDGNEIYFEGPEWKIYGGIAPDDDYENASNTPTIPLMGWVSDNNLCDPFPISVSMASCPSDVVPTLSEWGVIILGIFLAIMGALGVKTYPLHQKRPIRS